MTFATGRYDAPRISRSDEPGPGGGGAGCRGHHLDLRMAGEEELEALGEGADSRARGSGRIGGHPDASVGHLDVEPTIMDFRRDDDLEGPILRRRTVDEGVFQQRLEDHRRHGDGVRGRIALEPAVEALAESGLLDGKVVLQRLELPGEGLKRPRLAQGEAEIVGEILRHFLNRRRLDETGIGAHQPGRAGD